MMMLTHHIAQTRRALVLWPKTAIRDIECQCFEKLAVAQALQRLTMPIFDEIQENGNKVLDATDKDRVDYLLGHLRCQGAPRYASEALGRRLMEIAIWKQDDRAFDMFWRQWIGSVPLPSEMVSKIVQAYGVAKLQAM